MGFLLWGVVSAGVLASGYLLAGRFFADRSLPERLVVTWTAAVSIALLAMYLCGAVGLLTRWVLAPVALGICAGAAFVLREGFHDWKQLLRRDLRVPAAFVQELRSHPDPAVLAVLPGLMGVAAVLLSVWYFKTWSWDAVWYHSTLVSHTLSTGSLDVIPSHILQVTFPRNGELLSAWSCVFPMDNRLDDSGQVGFLLAGAVLVMAWARRVGASRPVAVGLGFAWVALPPVWLVAGTGNIDLVPSVCFAIAVFHLSRSAQARDRWIVLAAMGIYVGAKYHGVLHLLLLSPWMVFRWVQELRASVQLRRALGNIALSIGLFLALGSYFYVQNAVHFGNPVYPVPVTLPWVGTLPGVTNLQRFPAEVAILRGDRGRAFFGDAGSFVRMVGSWFSPHVHYIPDVKNGGFGPLFAWVLLPGLFLAAGFMLWRRSWRRVAPLFALFGLALVVPMAWWPRFIIGASVAATVAFGYLHAELRPVPLRWLASLALVGFCAFGFHTSWVGGARFNPFPTKLAAAMAATPAERAGMRLHDELWPEDAHALKEQELRPGDVFTYDESAYFMGELWTRDFRHRVVFVSSERSAQTYASQVAPMQPRWAGVWQGSAAERSLLQAGGEFLFVAPGTQMAVYRMR